LLECTTPSVSRLARLAPFVCENLVRVHLSRACVHLSRACVHLSRACVPPCRRVS
jgi:hypothetical protein